MLCDAWRRTCRRTLARSTGAMTAVVGMADMKPAAASSPIDKVEFARLGERANINALEVSYAWTRCMLQYTMLEEYNHRIPRRRRQIWG
jgi:hypothetical protein